ncbi:MAG: LPS export ABC transporter periplasmic protein LptC [Thermoanaerobaculia bacterium]
MSPARGGGRRRLELAVLAFGAVFLLVVLISFRPGRRPGAAAPPPEAGTEGPPGAGQATTVLSGVDFTESVKGKPLFRIRSEKTVGFGPGAGLLPNWYALENVELTVYTEEGTPVVVRGNRAEYDERSKRARLIGNVRWTDEEGALGETEQVEFLPDTRTLEIPTPIHFVRGTFDLRAAKGTYDVRNRLIRLQGPIRGSGTGEGSGGLSELAADSAIFRRAEGVVELEGNVSGASQGGDRITANRLVLKLDESGKRVEWARAFGAVRGALGDGATQTAPRSYGGDEGALFFTPEGATRSLGLTGNPAWVEEPKRRVTAGAIDVAFEDGRAVSASARGAVRIRSEEANARADRAETAFDSAGEVQSMDLSGRVEMSGKERSGRAERVVQVPGRGVWLLTGGAASSASVESGGSRVSAAHIELTEKPRGIRAEGNARAAFLPDAGKPKAPTLVGDPEKPTYAKADRMVFDEEGNTAVLSGRATLWQEGSSLFADDVTLNESERTLVAVGNVRAVLERRPQDRPKAEPARSTVTARRMFYREKEGRAIFEDRVVVSRGAWRAQGERATAHFAKGEEQKIERVELTGSVALHDEAAGRDATAEKATDFPAEGRTVLEGSPARVSDREGNRVAGATLTIRDRGRSVEVTAPEGGKTETVHRTKPS